MKCLCQVRSQLYVTITGSGAPLYCTAIDSIDTRLVGCCNEVDSNDVAMRRPSTCVPFIILCRTHKERLLRHNCCPSCGLFCTQGKFVQCANGHQFHRECETIVNKKSACPHCATESTIYEILITMNGTRKPVYIPTRRKFSKFPSAKMSLPGKGDNTKLAERPPSPLVSPEDIKIPEATHSDRPERFTIMSLYTSVKNGDLEKLVNVLGKKTLPPRSDSSVYFSLTVNLHFRQLVATTRIIRSGSNPTGQDFTSQRKRVTWDVYMF